MGFEPEDKRFSEPSFDIQFEGGGADVDGNDFADASTVTAPRSHRRSLKAKAVARSAPPEQFGNHADPEERAARRAENHNPPPVRRPLMRSSSEFGYLFNDDEPVDNHMDDQHSRRLDALAYDGRQNGDEQYSDLMEGDQPSMVRRPENRVSADNAFVPGAEAAPSGGSRRQRFARRSRDNSAAEAFAAASSVSAAELTSRAEPEPEPSHQPQVVVPEEPAPSVIIPPVHEERRRPSRRDPYYDDRRECDERDGYGMGYDRRDRRYPDPYHGQEPVYPPYGQYPAYPPYPYPYGYAPYGQYPAYPAYPQPPAYPPYGYPPAGYPPYGYPVAGVVYPAGPAAAETPAAEAPAEPIAPALPEPEPVSVEEVTVLPEPEPEPESEPAQGRHSQMVSERFSAIMQDEPQPEPAPEPEKTFDNDDFFSPPAAPANDTDDFFAPRESETPRERGGSSRFNRRRGGSDSADTSPRQSAAADSDDFGSSNDWFGDSSGADSAPRSEGSARFNRRSRGEDSSRPGNSGSGDSGSAGGSPRFNRRSRS